MASRRGVMEGMNPTDDGTEVVARAPMGEMVKYATDLRSMTQARGYFTKEFIGYEDVPGGEAKKIIEQAEPSDMGGSGGLYKGKTPANRALYYPNLYKSH